MDDPILQEEPCGTLTFKDYLKILWSLYGKEPFDILEHKLTELDRMVCLLSTPSACFFFFFSPYFVINL